MITEDQVDAALRYLQDSTEDYARARAAVRAATHKLKSLEATEFLAVEEKGAVDFKKSVARASDTMKEAINQYENSEYDFAVLEAKRERARISISLFQSMLKAGAENKY